MFRGFIGPLIIGVSIIIGLNFNFFLEKTSHLIYVYSGQQAIDIKSQEEFEKRKAELLEKNKKKELEEDKKNFARVVKDIIQYKENYFTNKQSKKYLELIINHNNKKEVCLLGYGSKKDYIQIKNLTNELIKNISVMILITNQNKSIKYYEEASVINFDYVVEKNEIKTIECPTVYKDDYELFLEKNALFEYIILNINDKYNYDYLREYKIYNKRFRDLKIEKFCNYYNRIKIKFEPNNEASEHCNYIKEEFSGL